MSVLSFLKDVKVTANPVKTPVSRSKDRNPASADIRIFSTGAIYPSAMLMKRFNLEYVSESNETKGNGFDIIDSREMKNTADNKPFLMIAPVAKNSGKVDLFGTTRYDENKHPLSSVMNQGANSKWLLDLISEVYGVAPDKGGYIDLMLVKDDVFADDLQTKTAGIYNVPKQVVRGENKGASSYVRRENLDIYILVPTSMLATPNGADIASNQSTAAVMADGNLIEA